MLRIETRFLRGFGPFFRQTLAELAIPLCNPRIMPCGRGQFRLFVWRQDTVPGIDVFESPQSVQGLYPLLEQRQPDAFVQGNHDATSTDRDVP